MGNKPEVEKLREQEDVKAALKQTAGTKESGRVKTQRIKKLLDRLNAEPERVLFPKSNLR